MMCSHEYRGMVRMRLTWFVQSTSKSSRSMLLMVGWSHWGAEVHLDLDASDRGMRGLGTIPTSVRFVISEIGPYYDDGDVDD